MKKTSVAALFLAGMLAGLWIARSGTEVLAQAQASWECRSWVTPEGTDVGSQLGSFLRNAGSVQLTSAQLASSRFVVVACKR
jgi:hypothetical protein